MTTSPLIFGILCGIFCQISFATYYLIEIRSELKKANDRAGHQS